MFNTIIAELKEHAPVTLCGAALGIIFMFIFRDMPEEVAHNLFFVFHPLHVLLSALATAGLYKHYQCRTDRRECNIFMLLFVGYVGAIGIATLSDSLIPYIGETILHMPHRHVHVGFLEKPWLINSLAIVGVIIAYVNPTTKFPHLGHVLLSTWASLFHVIMAKGQGITLSGYGLILIFLFISVWLPCCISDIVFPLLFVSNKKEKQ